MDTSTSEEETLVWIQGRADRLFADVGGDMSEWIPTGDSLPEPHVEVLVFAPEEEAVVFAAKIICDDWSRSSSNRYAPTDDYYGDARINVTHWMPLPTPPKETK